LAGKNTARDTLKEKSTNYVLHVMRNIHNMCIVSQNDGNDIDFVNNLKYNFRNFLLLGAQECVIRGTV
jgi:hypothetical protein